LGGTHYLPIPPVFCNFLLQGERRSPLQFVGWSECAKPNSGVVACSVGLPIVSPTTTVLAVTHPLFFTFFVVRLLGVIAVYSTGFPVFCEASYGYRFR